MTTEIRSSYFENSGP